MARVRELLGSSRLVSVTGPPGVGKTRLAVEVCHELAEQVQVVWVDLAPLRIPRRRPPSWLESAMPSTTLTSSWSWTTAST